MYKTVFGKVVVATVLTAVVGTTAFADLSMPSSPNQQSRTEEFRTSTGATCRQLIDSNDGTMFDSGVLINKNDSSDSKETGLFFRISKPLGVKKRDNYLDCNRMLKLEEAKMKEELRLLELRTIQTELQIEQQKLELESRRRLQELEEGQIEELLQGNTGTNLSIGGLN